MIDWKARLRSKPFWVAMISLIILLSQQLGLDLPSNMSDICNTILTMAVVIGIVVDTSTTGISDK